MDQHKLEEDAETGELVLTFSENFLKREDWRQGDRLLWEEAKQGQFTLRNLSKEER